MEIRSLRSIRLTNGYGNHKKSFVVIWPSIRQLWTISRLLKRIILQRYGSAELAVAREIRTEGKAVMTVDTQYDDICSWHSSQVTVVLDFRPDSFAFIITEGPSDVTVQEIISTRS